MLPLTTATDWLQAIGGIGTAGIALYLLGQAQFDRWRTARSREREQASRITLSEENVRRIWIEEYQDRAAHVRVLAEFKVRNLTADVISDVTLVVRWRKLADPPGKDNHAGSAALRRLDGDSEKTLGITLADLPPDTEGWDQLFNIFQLSFQFTDAAGLRWERDLSHVLRPVKESRRAQRDRLKADRKPELGS